MKMKRMKFLWIVMVMSITFSIAPTVQSHAIVWVVVKAALVKVIKAMDLAVQRLQNKTIWLQNAQKTLENTLSKLKLDEISDWTDKHKAQYQKYYEELSKVRAVISGYQRVKDMMTQQVRIVASYKKAFELFKQDKNFTADEIAYMTRVYTGMVNESIKNLDLLLSLIRDKDFKMTDGRRLELLNKAADRMDEVLSDIKLFNQQNMKMSLQRAKDQNEVKVLKQLYEVE